MHNKFMMSTTVDKLIFIDGSFRAGPQLPELIPVSVACSRQGVLLLPLDGMLVHRRLPLRILLLVAIIFIILLGGNTVREKT